MIKGIRAALGGRLGKGFEARGVVCRVLLGGRVEGAVYCWY